MDKKKVSEAIKEKKAGEASLITSLFGNWKPDYDSAAHHYEKAGQLFKLAKEYSESKTCYTTAAQYYESCRVLFSAGKCHEGAAQCSKELGDFSESHKHIEQAGSFFAQNGTVSTAVQCYNKGAELLSTKLPELAAQLYCKSGELEQNFDHPRDAVKAYQGAKKIYARNKMYKECVDIVKLIRDLYMEMSNPAQVSKCNLSLVILHLARGDSIAAKASIEGHVSLVADELIDAVESGDDQTIRKLASHGDVVYLDTDIARIAKFLSQDGADVPSSTPNKPSPSTGTVFKSAGNNSASASLKSQRNELFSRPNKDNRQELFNKRSNVKSTSKPQPTFNKEPVHSNPFGEAPHNSNPFGEDDSSPSCVPPHSSNPFDEVPHINNPSGDSSKNCNPFTEETDNSYPFNVEPCENQKQDIQNPFEEEDDLC